jgi:lysozyme family protein
MTFDDAFAVLVDPQHEGGYSSDPNDSGNWTGGKCGDGALKGTKFGISAASYPDEDIANLTLERARSIYFADFWVASGCEQLPDALRYQMFDLAVNTSAPKHPTTAIKLLQRAVGAVPDGVLGPETISKATAMESRVALSRLRGRAIQRYTDFETWGLYGRGWMRRMAANMLAD